MGRKRQTNAASALISSVTADMLASYDDTDSLGQDKGLRVERILLDLVRPNPLQARRVLPDRVYQDFHAERVTPTQALREVVKLVKIASKQTDNLSRMYLIRRQVPFCRHRSKDLPAQISKI